MSWKKISKECQAYHLLDRIALAQGRDSDVVMEVIGGAQDILYGKLSDEDREWLDRRPPLAPVDPGGATDTPTDLAVDELVEFAGAQAKVNGQLAKEIRRLQREVAKLKKGTD